MQPVAVIVGSYPHLQNAQPVAVLYVFVVSRTKPV